MIEFPDYPTVLMRMLNQCIREPHIYLAVFIMQPTGEGRLDFIQVRALPCKTRRGGGGDLKQRDSGLRMRATRRGQEWEWVHQQ